MTQVEVERKLDDIVFSYTGIKPNTVHYNQLTNYIEIEATFLNDKNFIALNRSFKLKNIKIDFKKVLYFLTENALAIGMTYDSMDAYKAVLLVLINIIKMCTDVTVKLNEDMVKVVQYLHKRNAYSEGITVKEIRDNIQLKDDIEIVLKDLIECKSIAIDNDKYILCEKVIVRNKKDKQPKPTKIKNKISIK